VHSTTSVHLRLPDTFHGIIRKSGEHHIVRLTYSLREMEADLAGTISTIFLKVGLSSLIRLLKCLKGNQGSTNGRTGGTGGGQDFMVVGSRAVQ
jgi:hypothetical protein